MSCSAPSSPLIGIASLFRFALQFCLIFVFVDLKIVILGGGGVGKTSFIHRYTCNEFTDTVSVILLD